MAQLNHWIQSGKLDITQVITVKELAPLLHMTATQLGDGIRLTDQVSNIFR